MPDAFSPREAARFAKLQADLRSEGASEEMVNRLATPDAAKRMVDYEDRVVGMIYGMFRQ